MRNIFVLILFFVFSSSNGQKTNDGTIIGVKIYERQTDYGSLFLQWKDLGINTAYVSVDLAYDIGFRTKAKQADVDIYIIFPVFFDAEDNGGIEDWDWILGSRAFVEHLENPPSAVIIVDMVGDVDLKIYKEYNSNQELNDQIWEHARLLGYENVFLPEYKFSILDDHIPFLEAGIPAVDIIDLDYHYWHTTQDTVDKVSAESLQVVGDTLFAWLLSMELSP